MAEVEHVARRKSVWLEGGWNSNAVTRMWSMIWYKLDRYLRTESKGKNGELNYNKSRQGQLAWRTFYNKLYNSGKNFMPSNCEASVAGSPGGTEQDC